MATAAVQADGMELLHTIFASVPDRTGTVTKGDAFSTGFRVNS